MEFTVIRVGECKACGWCCPKDCEHFDGKLCKIHEHKPEECRAAPEFPMRKGNPECGYRFYIKERPDLEVFEMLCTKVQPED